MVDYLLDVRLLHPPRRLCFHQRLFVCWQDCAKNTQPIFTKFVGNVAQGPRKNPLDSGSGRGANPYHVTSRLWLRLGGAERHPTTLGFGVLFTKTRYINSHF